MEARDPAISRVLHKALRERELTKAEISRLMNTNDIIDLYSIFSAAQRIREKKFGNDVFPYGFIYASTYCRNHCVFCFYRKPNVKCLRYRKTPEEILEIASQLKKSGVHLIDLTMSEDPLIHDEKHFGSLVSLVKRIVDDIGLPVMVSPGVIPRRIIRDLAQVGADWFALYQETHNRELFDRLRVGQSFDARMNAKLQAKKEGLLIEEGVLIGVGETHQDRVNSILAMKRIGAHQVREMGFQPQPNTPMENCASPPILDEMKFIAIMRITQPGKLIPASYDIDGGKGLQLRLMAGANLVTSLIPPRSGLAGVAQSKLNVECGLRTVKGVEPYLEQIGLRFASRKRYIEWVKENKARVHMS
ncbi:MAG: methylornithine synthase PylB [Candidatus Bathyarchaeota archaeon]|nr:MAG: methylornithine synthase PylB [Candidatus Bathyarchaeota archaeon]